MAEQDKMNQLIEYFKNSGKFNDEDLKKIIKDIEKIYEKDNK